ncbi:hypothetical protein DJ030_14890 [bacterium endosymbiont of Escarpia laminata]|nr:MAG: hypothetical protein DJ030_14890 [bacterium endosymbiont of Escarpia laminata]
MSLDKNSTITDLRSELDRKGKRALDLQTNTTDPTEWSNLNAIRWELEDLDNDLYLSQFVKNNDKINKLIGQIAESSKKAKKILVTLDEAQKILSKARTELQQTSAMFDELEGFYNETETLLIVLKG